jgi:hypothetical protein
MKAMDPRTGRMKEVDRVVEATVENALKLKAEWRAEVRRGDRAAADVPRLTDRKRLALSLTLPRKRGRELRNQPVRSGRVELPQS